MYKVSIIIPAFNALKYLPETLDTVLSQTFRNFEVLIINDGSTDGIEDWFSKITDPRVKIISQSNQGLAAARNTGIANAKGEYIAFLDADDLWDANKLEKQVYALENNPEVGLVYTWVLYINDTGESTGRLLKHQAEGDVWKQLTQYNFVECGSVAMVRRYCLETVGKFDPSLGSVVEDWDMWLRIATKYDFKAVKEPLVFYRQTSSSGSKNYAAMEKSLNLAIEKAFDSTPAELLNLKKSSYASAYLCIAWKTLQNQSPDYRKAVNFRTIAATYCPQVRFSKEYLRLSFAIIMMQYLGRDYYKKLLALFHALRR
ncbi:MAG: glycosyltransferase family 2 protein [Scytonematopsis contorta HA4267-MV1]|jgi:glycosyltransferase involved in cell wall biosynthesis|nr:glycosyltransferase family 2 protein [Scytonematopsis contorta HA4267-MV1]